MSLTSLSFLGVYFPVLLLVYNIPFFKNKTIRKIILLAVSLGLYAFAEPAFVLLLVGMILWNYLLVLLAQRTKLDFFRGAAIVADAMVLVFFKYINAFMTNSGVNCSLSNIIMPIGLSYFTFKAISFVVDSKVIGQGSFIDVALYISNFMTIVSGPLSMYEDELVYIREGSETRRSEAMYNGFERIIIGLAKKVVIADSLSVLVKQCFALGEMSAVMAWAGAIAYSLQLFFDFSGYTDMAIGVGSLFGFKLPENFNYPYMAASITDFWKRWHISLTKWFTKYIYYPLGGSRVDSTERHIFNLFVVWLVTGMWHGSTLTFILWALLYFVFQLVEKYTRWADILKKLHIGHVYTLLIVVMEWVIFRSSSVSSAFSYIRSMFCLNGNNFLNPTDFATISRYAIPFVAGIVFSSNLGEKIKGLTVKKTWINAAYNISLLVLLAVSIIITLSMGYTAPLYAGF